MTHSSILAWRIPWTEEPGRLQFMGLQRVGHDWATNAFTLSVTNIVEHLYVLAVHVSSLVKCHFKSFAHFLIGLFVFLLNYEAICTHTYTYIYKNKHMLVIPPLWDIRFTNIFSQPFHFLNDIFWRTNVSNFDKVQFIICFLYGSCFWCHV